MSLIDMHSMQSNINQVIQLLITSSPSKFFNKRPQHFERIEQLNTSASIEVSWLDEPYILTFIHFLD